METIARKRKMRRTRLGRFLLLLDKYVISTLR